MPAAKTKAKSKTKKDPELEINAKWSGPKFWEEWGKEGKAKMGKDNSGGGGMLYFVGFIGAVVYWMQAAVGFGAVVTGFLKALVWPAYVVYKLLELFYGVVS
ncbi:MAG: hypothetical protein R3313_00905 [Candidatus Saccharimonadales bacterium]|nr:hypothetical protein [Candidatus Saccharimonadales bacterium]